jgi:hypothetical protein
MVIANLNTRFRKLAIIAVLIGLLAVSGVYSALTVSVTIPSSGIIAGNDITALSGSPSDIQAAVNAVVAAGGGTVHIPAGKFTFNPPVNGIGVTIPYTNVPIAIIGAGIGQTILTETQFEGFSTMFARTYSGQSYSAASVRISGISFAGLVLTTNLPIGITDDWNTQDNVGISLKCTQDFRIDDCSFTNFCGAAIEVADNTGSAMLVDRGVIDHCSIDNPYRNFVQPYNATGAYYAVGGYGIIVLGDYYSWDLNIADYLGQWNPTTTTNSTNCPTGIYGSVVPQPVYIENCNFTQCRHCISGNAGAYYVARYDYFAECYLGACDMHGYTGNPAPINFGTRGSEVYSNIFNLTNEAYSGGQDDAWRPRGGGGVFWNNTVYLNNVNGPNACMIMMFNDGEPYPYDVEQAYVWNNTCNFINGTVTNGDNSIVIYNGGYVANVNYFLFAPNGTNVNGLTGPTYYTPYTYPLPLTQTAL